MPVALAADAMLDRRLQAEAQDQPLWPKPCKTNTFLAKSVPTAEIFMDFPLVQMIQCENPIMAAIAGLSLVALDEEIHFIY